MIRLHATINSLYRTGTPRAVSGAAADAFGARYRGRCLDGHSMMLPRAEKFDGHFDDDARHYAP